MDYKQLTDFPRSYRRLWQMGGQYQKAADAVSSAIGKIGTGIEPLAGLRKTKHGESRLPKCIKYDLTGFARLITIQDNGIVLFCFAGDHKSCEAWLEQNRGIRLLEANGTIINAFESLSVADENKRITGAAVLAPGTLHERLPEELFDVLVEGLPRSTVRALESLEPTHSEEAILAVAQKIADVDGQAAVYDVFALLRRDKVEEAVKRIKLFTGAYATLEQLSIEEIKALADSERIKSIPSNDPHFQQVFEYYARSAKYLDWMLFLHPDQKDKVDADYEGPTKLVGVSGSGKTCVAIQRAIRLAERYDDSTILVLTLNRPLARLIGELVDAAALPGVQDRIKVLPFFSLCQHLLHKFEPENDKLYDDVTWKSREHIDEIWREYYRCELNNDDAKALIPVHDSLICRGVAAETYIREEFDWIRSAVHPTNRRAYLDMPRTGRSFGLDRGFRQMLLDALELWEKKMRHVGVTDYLGLSTALSPYIEKLSPMYRCILVDESQDFGTIELSIIRRLAQDGPNNLFFCGDAAQQVKCTHQSFSRAGITIPATRCLAIKKNYRNSREILSAAYAVLAENVTEELMYAEDFELLDPEYANFSGATPLLLDAKTLSDEIAYAFSFMKDETGGEKRLKGCLVFCGYSPHELEAFARKVSLPLLDGTISIDKDDLYISDLEHTKGFEFEVVCIVNCSSDAMPNPATPQTEQFRDLSRFYVAMTRAKTQLVLSYSRSPSPLLKNVERHFLTAAWADYIPMEVDKSLGVPPRLEEIRRHQDDVALLIADMTGPQFLYTEHAVGLEPALVDKIRERISGQRRLVENVPTHWRNMGGAAYDVSQIVGSRKEFGPETSRAFRDLGQRLGLLMKE